MIMQLQEYFTNGVQTCSWKDRRIGVEVETLFVDEQTEEPISRRTAQGMFAWLVQQRGWDVQDVKDGVMVRIAKGGYALIFELGWNNIEIITPAYCRTQIAMEFLCLQDRLNDIYAAAQQFHARPVYAGYDGYVDVDTLMLPDKRDQVWTQLDGPVLKVLGHIASVHVNIDLCSFEEGEDFLRRLNGLYQQASWPPREIRDVWHRYIAQSCAAYEAGRYGPPPGTIPQYIQTMAHYKVVMGMSNGELVRIKNPRPFVYSDPSLVDLPLFFRSIWWWSRLRVRNGKLVLEARAIPRGTDEQLYHDIQRVLDTLGV